MSDDTCTPTPPTSPTPFALGVREAAAALCLSPRTVEALASEGKLPSFTVGRRRLFSAEALRAWVQQQQAQQGGRR